ncbi:hypothetical protein ACFYY8_24700 [Streptosporangium sp. NPDC001559]|uniref:hypothetical protein n=1 Tax=Streptosporangium sp. NPDC001559 TaxID=3366187 RepID=UPI0036E714BB
MKICRLPAALLATALGAAVLAGAASASASVNHQTASVRSAESAAFAPLPPDWYWSKRYETMDACRAGWQDAAEHGDFTGLRGCRYYAGDQYRQAGYYFLIYIP